MLLSPPRESAQRDITKAVLVFVCLFFPQLLQAQQFGTELDPDRDGLTTAQENFYGSNPRKADTDGDFIKDGDEILIYQTSATNPDTDGDGLTDLEEVNGQTNPRLADTDGGGILDGQEINIDGTDPTNFNDDVIDTDGDGLLDFQERAMGTSVSERDTDGDGRDDGEEDANRNAIYEGDINGNGEFDPGDETDPLSPDTDGDEVSDFLEVVIYESNPYSTDSDGDGLSDTIEHANRALYPCLKLTSQDSEGDGLSDLREVESGASDPCSADSDGDGVYDFGEINFDGTNAKDARDVKVDTDHDGLSDDSELQNTRTDPQRPDTDQDGILDSFEIIGLGSFTTDPLDRDSDDDGLLDGTERIIRDADRTPIEGSSKGDVDTDRDGIPDGVEIGVTAPVDGFTTLSGTLIRGTSLETTYTTRDGQVRPTFPEDPYAGVLSPPHRNITNSALIDSDGDTLTDAQEDLNLNGYYEPELGETRPDNPDTDGDGMTDGWEVQYGDPQLWPQGFEPEFRCSLVPDGFLNPRVPDDLCGDADADGIYNIDEFYELSRREAGIAVPFAPTPENPVPEHPCDSAASLDEILAELEGHRARARLQEGIPVTLDPCASDSDADGLSDFTELTVRYGGGTTNPIAADTDQDGLIDGDEVSATPVTNPLLSDTDADTLNDGEERSFGTDPTAPDTDQDCVEDGPEVKIHRTNPLNEDTDGDALSDGLELGRAECGDADPGTLTDPNSADTDGDGLPDGLEDSGNQNGRFDEGETDPLAADTDGDGLEDGAEDINLDGVFQSVDGETDPRKPDTDGGGLTDGEESLQPEFDPNDPEDDRPPRVQALETQNEPLDTDDPSDDQDADELPLAGADETGGSDTEMAARDDGGVPSIDPLAQGSAGDEQTDDIPDGVDPAGVVLMSELPELPFGERDDDGDGILNRYETDEGEPRDSDEDGVFDQYDRDSDNDGLDDVDEARLDFPGGPPRDSDGDGLPDYRDTDSDNGTVDDGTEVLVRGNSPVDPSDDLIGWPNGPSVISGGSSGCSVGHVQTNSLPLPHSLFLFIGLTAACRRRGKTK